MPERERVFEVDQSDFDDYNGICLACGEIQYGGVEPDARNYFCEACYELQVFGLEQALLLNRITLVVEEGFDA
jgi:hypothetical protein